MSVSLSSPPPALAFSADLITARFNCTNYLSQSGVKSVNTIPIAGNAAVTIKYGGKTIVMSPVANQDDSGTSFDPANPLPSFKSNPYLAMDYEMSYGNQQLVLTAKKAAQGYDISGYNTVIGLPELVKPNYTISFKLYCESADNSNFELIYDSFQPMIPGANGSAEVPLGDKLHEFLTRELRVNYVETPAGGSMQCKKSCRRYYFEFAERFGVTPVVRKLQTSDQFTILHGGLSYIAQFNSTLQGLIAPGAPAADRFLKQGNNNIYTRADQPQFLYWFNTREAFAGFLKVTAFYKNGGSVVQNLYGQNFEASRKYSWDLTYDTIVAPWIDASEIVTHYDVQLFTSGAARSEVRTYTLNYQYRQYARYFLFWSSFGSLDTRLCYGKGSSEFALDQKEAGRSLYKGYDVKQGNAHAYDLSGRSTWKAATGYMSKSELIANRDFFLSAFKYRYSRALMLPIRIDSKTIPEVTDGNYLYAQEFDYSYQFDDHNYTEGDDEDSGPSPGDFFFSSASISNTAQRDESDPTVPSWVKSITQEDIYKWNSGNSGGGGLPNLNSPTFDGVGAYGTWNISISGNARTSDYSANSGQWEGKHFADYIDQPIRKDDDVAHRSISSPLFTSGFAGSGWRVDANGDATFDNLTVRKEFNVYELVLNKISGTNGSLAVTDTIKIFSVDETDTGYDCTIDTADDTVAVPFRINDLLRCQVWNGKGIKYYFAKVTASGNGTFTLDKATKKGTGIPAAADVVVRFGNTINTDRQGLLYLTASDDNSPYLDVLDGVTSDDLSGKTKVRLGRMDGIVDPTFGPLSGYGLYAQKAYLTDGHFKGTITVTGGNAETKEGAAAQIQGALNNLTIVNRNYFSRTSTLQNIGQLALQHVNGDINGVSGVTNGIFAVGNPNSLTSFRIQGVITKNGDWTVSGYIMSNGNFVMSIDICDNVPPKDIAITSSGFTYFEHTVNVQNHSDAVYNFVDFNNLQYVYLYIKNLKIEQGNKATDWSEAQEDLQEDLDTAKAQSAQAIAELAAIADDGILDVSEKVGALKDFRAIAANIDSREQQAATYNLSIADIDSKYHALLDYVTPLFNDMSVNSPINRDEFINKFNDYYRAEQVLLQAITDTADGKIQAKGYSSGKMLYTDPEFSGSYGQNGYNGIAVYNNVANGTVAFGRGVNYSDFTSGGLPANPNSSGCYIHIAYYGGGASPGLGGFFFGNQTRANAVFITRIVAMIPVGYGINWASNEFGDPATRSVTWLTSQAGTGKWEEYLVRVKCGEAPLGSVFSSTNFFYLDGPNVAVDWYLSYATVFDMSAAPTDYANDAQAKANSAQSAAIVQANAYAASIAQSKADTAQAAALSQASSDAQARADAAYNASVFASNAYANTVSNSAASAAQVAAAADASNKANAVYASAQAYADSQSAALTSAIQNLPYQTLYQYAVNGQAVLIGGFFNINLIKADAVWANIVNAGYLTASQINALNVNFTQGTIGGIVITNGSIDAPNFQLRADGQLQAYNAYISGTINANSGMIGGFALANGYMQGVNGDSMGGRFVLSPTGGFIAFINDATGSFAGIGSNVVSAAAGVKVLGRFENVENNAAGLNIGMVAKASGAAQNIAIDITSGAIRMGGAQYHYHTRTTAGSGYACTEQDYIVIIEDNGSTSGSYYLPSAGRTVNRKITIANQSRVSQTIQGNGVNIKTGLNNSGSVSIAANSKMEFVFRSDNLWQLF